MRRNVWSKSVESEKNPYFWEDKPQLIGPRENCSENKFFMVDLFCGCGGFSVGFEWAGFVPILGVDIHPQSLETFSNNHARAAVIKGDMRKVTTRLLREAVQGRHISVIAAGVPCQGFSLCNRKRHKNDQRNFLFLEFIRCVKLFKPEFVLLENVSGLASMANGVFKRDISFAIEECGYEVDFRILNAINYGVPQLRQRVFFLGARNDLEIRWPAPASGINGGKVVTVWDAIGDLPILEAGQSKNEYDKNPFTGYQKYMRSGCCSLKNHSAPNHPQEVIDKIAATKPGMPMYPKFKQRIRLNPNEPSPTQVSGGIRPQFQFGHPTQARGLSVRERCRIQSFPDSFEIFGGTVQGRIQTGNAVPPLLAKAIAKQIMGSLKREEPTEESLPKKATQVELWASKEFYMEEAAV